MISFTESIDIVLLIRVLYLYYISAIRVVYVTYMPYFGQAGLSFDLTL